MFMTGKIVVTGAFVNMTVSFRRYLLMLRQPNLPGLFLAN